MSASISGEPLPPGISSPQEHMNYEKMDAYDARRTMEKKHEAASTEKYKASHPTETPKPPKIGMGERVRAFFGGAFCAAVALGCAPLVVLGLELRDKAADLDTKRKSLLGELEEIYGARLSGEGYIHGELGALPTPKDKIAELRTSDPNSGRPKEIERLVKEVEKLDSKRSAYSGIGIFLASSAFGAVAGFCHAFQADKKKFL